MQMTKEKITQATTHKYKLATMLLIITSALTMAQITMRATNNKIIATRKITKKKKECQTRH